MGWGGTGSRYQDMRCCTCVQYILHHSVCVFCVMRVAPTQSVYRHLEKRQVGGLVFISPDGRPGHSKEAVRDDAVQVCVLGGGA